MHCRLLSSLAPKSIEFVWMEIDKKGPTLYLLNLQCVHCARCTHAEVQEMFSFVWYKNIKKGTGEIRTHDLLFTRQAL